MEKKRKKIEKGKVENWKWKEEKSQNKERTYFFFFFVTFQNHWNLFWVYQNGNFPPGKSISCRKKIQEKMTLPPQKNFPLTPLNRNVIWYCEREIPVAMISGDTKSSLDCAPLEGFPLKYQWISLTCGPVSLDNTLECLCQQYSTSPRRSFCYLERTLTILLLHHTVQPLLTMTFTISLFRIH